MAGGLSAAPALGAGQIIRTLVDPARPFAGHPGVVRLFTRHAADASFPSDDATASFAIAVAIVLRRRVWVIVVLILAAVLSIGRVALGLRYPTDVIGGAVLDSAAALLLWSPPLRSRVDWLADAAGRLWDGIVMRLLGVLRPGLRA